MWKDAVVAYLQTLSVVFEENQG